MRTHALFLRLDGRRCVIVGGDAAAAAKAAACLRAGAEEVVVVAASLGPELAELVAAGRARHVARGYREGDLAGAVLAYASTRDRSLAARLAREAERERVLLNVIDTPELCTFLAPAVLERGELQIAVGTGGASPGLAARLRRDLEGRVGAEYAPFVAILGAVRRVLGPERREVCERLLRSPLLDLVREGRRGEIDALLAREAGAGVTLARLGVPLEAP